MFHDQRQHFVSTRLAGLSLIAVALSFAGETETFVSPNSRIAVARFICQLLSVLIDKMRDKEALPDWSPRDPKVTMGPIDDLPHTDYTTSREGQRRNFEV
jgi:hypothetical protein